ncbi:MAG: hypothetical protein WC483_01160 [Candidatus Paceibacterota bacterium]
MTSAAGAAMTHELLFLPRTGIRKGFFLDIMTGEKRDGPLCDLGYINTAFAVGGKICIIGNSIADVFAILDITTEAEPFRYEVIPPPPLAEQYAFTFTLCICAEGRDRVGLRIMTRKGYESTAHRISFDVRRREWVESIHDRHSFASCRDCDGSRSPDMNETESLANDRWLVRRREGQIVVNRRGSSLLDFTTFPQLGSNDSCLLLIGNDLWDVSPSEYSIIFYHKSLLSEEGMVEEWRCPRYEYMTRVHAIVAAPHFILLLPCDGTVSQYYLFDTIHRAGMPIGDQGPHFSMGRRGRRTTRPQGEDYIPVNEFISAE